MCNLKKMRPVWAEIDLDNLAHNIREVRRITDPSAIVTAVVKADGYGHGAVKISQTLLENGADRLAVAVLDEAIELRKAGYKVPVLVLGYTNPEQSSEVIKFNIEQTIYSLETAAALSSEAVKNKKEAKVHIKINTGMSRIGFYPDAKSIETIINISKLPAIKVEGIFTHFASADEEDKSFTEKQYRKFQWVCDELIKANLEIPIKHVANSAAIIDLPEMHMDMVRAGIMLYALTPLPEALRATDLRQVMTLKARISDVKIINAGESVSYGRTFIADKSTIVATLPIGYADGFCRKLSGQANALVHGIKVPVIGRICMDQCMLDVTDVQDVKIGDEAVLFGSQGDSFITIDEIAKKLDTINHEIVCGISKRVPRVYIKNGKVIDVANYYPA
ncbi:MAG: alanine racemase [Bacillota bacterium]